MCEARYDAVGSQEVPKGGNPNGSGLENLMCLSEVEGFLDIMSE